MNTVINASRNDAIPILIHSFRFDFIICMFISVPARNVKIIPPTLAMYIIHGSTCNIPRFPAITPIIISSIEMDMLHFMEIILASIISIASITG